MDIEKSHRKIIATQVKAIALAAFAALSMSIFSGWRQQVNYNDTVQDVAQQEAENTMWRIVAGEEKATELSEVTRFAVDMEKWVAEGNNPEDFVGANQRYVGLSESVGFEVFQESACNDCGKLSQESLDNIAFIIENGNADANVEVITLNSEEPSWFSMGDAFALVAAWQIGGAAGLGLGLWRYMHPEMIWRRKDGVTDTEETISYVLAPLAHAAIQPWMSKKRKELKLQEETFYSQNGLDTERADIVLELAKLKEISNPDSHTLFVISELEEALEAIDELPHRVREAAAKSTQFDANQSALELAEKVKIKAHTRVETAREIGA